MQDHAEKMLSDRRQLLFEASILIDRRKQVALHAGAVFGNDDFEQASFSTEVLVERTL